MTKRKFQTDLFRLQCQTKIQKSRYIHTRTYMYNKSYVLFNALTILHIILISFAQIIFHNREHLAEAKKERKKKKYGTTSGVNSSTY